MEATLLDALSVAYEKGDYKDDFPAERPILSELIPRLEECLQPIALLEPLGVGSTAVVLKCAEPRLNQMRALKFPRPRLGKLSKIIRVIRGESQTLASLNHQNVIKLHHLGEVEFTHNTDKYSFPYFIMDFIKGVADFDDYILKDRLATPEDIITWFRDATAGVAYLHQRAIVHCDLKPGNILLAPETGALVADLGYAKHFPRVSARPGKTELTYTPEFAHPDLRAQMRRATDEAASVALVERDALRIQFDLFSLGRTFRKTLLRLRDEELAGNRANPFTPYQWQYLNLIRVRLQDGRSEGEPAVDPLLSDTYPGVSTGSLKEISYESADEALEDFEKLLSLYDLESRIPELAGDQRSYIQIPAARVPATPRVIETIAHPAFRRLTQVTQLGFVSLVYPSAAHSRFEHSLGVFEQACGLIRGLWYDPANAFFRSVLRERDLVTGLVAALIHDIGQYPMAHDLTEVSDRFSHEQFTESALFSHSFEGVRPLADVLRAQWGITAEEVLGVLRASEASKLRDRLLHSIISGPIDADKLDYLVRDGVHLGVTFGAAIDRPRLLCNITTCIRSHFDQKQGSVQTVAEIGVTDRALAVADSIWRARRDMFRQVYWQHTVRSLKAMLAYVVRRICIEMDRRDGDEAARRQRSERQSLFWREFKELVLQPLSGLNGERSKGREDEVNDDFLGTAERGWRRVSWLAASDDAVLGFLGRFSDERGRDVLDMIRDRRVFKRLRVLSGRGDAETFETIYSRFRAYLGEDQQQSIEEWRASEERRVREQFENSGIDLSDIRPLVLLDVPVKSARKPLRQEALWYLDEASGRSPDVAFEILEPGRSSIEVELSHFDRSAGKIRWFIHPDASLRLIEKGIQLPDLARVSYQGPG